MFLYESRQTPSLWVYSATNRYMILFWQTSMSMPTLWQQQVDPVPKPKGENSSAPKIKPEEIGEDFQQVRMSSV
jgi:hypothetical protein